MNREYDSHYFSLYHEKLSICNVCVKFHDNQSAHCWDIAFIKRWSKIAVANIARNAYLRPPISTRQRLRNFCINKNKMVA